jgi:hypothetical protein
MAMNFGVNDSSSGYYTYNKHGRGWKASNPQLGRHSLWKHHHLGPSLNVLLYVKEEPRSRRSCRESPEACHQALTVVPLSILWVWPVGRIREMKSSRGYSLPMILKQSDVVERMNIEYIVLPNERRRSI